MNNKKYRQYFGILMALVSYYLVHEGAHFLYAIIAGVFKQINIVNIIGVQIDVYREQMSDTMLGEFCLMGPIATFIVSWILILSTSWFCKSDNKGFLAAMHYITIVMMFLDPLYLSVLYRFVGGGDMNGIALLFPEMAVSIVSGLIFLLNIFIFAKKILPSYKNAFKRNIEGTKSTKQ